MRNQPKEKGGVFFNIWILKWRSAEKREHKWRAPTSRQKRTRLDRATMGGIGYQFCHMHHYTKTKTLWKRRHIPGNNLFSNSEPPTSNGARIFKVQIPMQHLQGKRNRGSSFCYLLLCFNLVTACEQGRPLSKIVNFFEPATSCEQGRPHF